MRHIISKNPQFYVTAPQECPYLDNKVERKLFTALYGGNSNKLNNSLSKQGFRRSQNVLYRPSCSSCSSCLSARIPVATFKKSRSQKRILKLNSDLTRIIREPIASDDQYRLFTKYITQRHSNGGMSDMDSDDFSAMIEETNVNTKVVEYYLKSEIEDKLISFSLIDILDDGVSMVYSIFDPEMEKRGLGNFMILDHIQLVEEFKTDHVYLGYWVKGSSKMDYKKHYKPLQLFKENSWVSSDKSLRKERLNELSARREKLPNQDPIYLPED